MQKFPDNQRYGMTSLFGLDSRLFPRKTGSQFAGRKGSVILHLSGSSAERLRLVIRHFMKSAVFLNTDSEGNGS